MTLISVMAMMTLFAVALLAVAPSVHLQVQREKELEAIRRGEDVAQAIAQYFEYHGGRKLPNSIDELLEGLPQGTKKRQILRESSAVDPLSPDGRWRLIKEDPRVLARFAKSVQAFNNGMLPGNRSRLYDRFVITFVNSINDFSDEEPDEPDPDFELLTENTPFIGVSSQSKAKAVVRYYGIGNHSKWIFTPLFRGESRTLNAPPRPIRPMQPVIRDPRE
jgi:type II secretory pathway pseudopilin PulG